MKIYISNNQESLKTALDKHSRTATVEAEYGSEVVKGSIATLAHHGERSGNPCPCLGDNIQIDVESIGISHFDLDTLGGIQRVLKKREPGQDLFWELAAAIDIKGAHKINDIRTDLKRKYSAWNPQLCRIKGESAFDFGWNVAIEQLHAFWAWSEKNRLFPPRDGPAEDVTDFILNAINVLDRILDDDPELIAAGSEWLKEKAQLNCDSFCQTIGPVILRKSDAFVNHLYVTPDGKVCKAVVAYNTTTNAITVSLGDPIDGFTANEFVKSIWGPLAGGHATIGGSPRGKKHTFSYARTAAEKLSMEINAFDCKES